jgi:hypothetical protein
VPDEVVAIVDVKCPGSGEAAHMHWPNLEQLSAQDEVKFVIADRTDFDYARDVVARVRSRIESRGGAVLAGARPAGARRSGPLDSRRAPSTSACSSRRTSTFGSPETRGV